MLKPVGDKAWENNNNDIPPSKNAQANSAIIESPQDNFEAIFLLLGEALKCIRKYQLRAMQELGVVAIQRNYEEIANEIRTLRNESRMEDSRVTALLDRFDALVSAREALCNTEGYVKLCWIYRQLRDLYNEELSSIRPQEATFSVEPSGKTVDEKLPVCNFLGLLEESPALKGLSPKLHGPLNDKMREAFVQTIPWIRKQIGSRGNPTCFICFNTSEKDVIKWLNDVLIPDLKSIGVWPICSKEYLAAGSDLEEFQERAGKEDFAIVLCTPELHRKYLNQPHSGVAVEIGYMQGRFEQKKGTTIPILLKRDGAGDPNDVNPFKDHLANPFAVLAPLNNYSGILELFVTLLNNSGPLILHRKLAAESIKTIKSEGIRVLENLLGQQSRAERSAFEECLPMFNLPMYALRACILYDGQSLTERWIKEHLWVDMNHLCITTVLYPEQMGSALEKADFFFRIKTEKILDSDHPKHRVSIFLGEKGFQFDVTSDTNYFQTAIKIFALMKGADIIPIWNDFLKKKEAKIQIIADALAKEKQAVEFAPTTKDQLLFIVTKDLAFAKKDQPETITTRLIQVYHKLSEYNLRKGNLPQAKNLIADAAKWSMHKYGRDHQSTLFYRMELARICYELGAIDEGISDCQAVLEAKEDHYTARLNLGRLNHILGETERAEENLILALSLSEASGSTRVEYAHFLLNNYREEEAIGCLLPVISDLDDGSTLSYCSSDRLILPDELHNAVSSKISLSAKEFAYYLLIRAYIQAGNRDLALVICQQFGEALLLKPSTLGNTLLDYSKKLLGDRE